jgi:hypothetical protein
MRQRQTIRECSGTLGLGGPEPQFHPQPASAQLCSNKPGTFENSPVLLVTSVAFRRKAWVAIKVSREPMGESERSSPARSFAQALAGLVKEQNTERREEYFQGLPVAAGSALGDAKSQPCRYHAAQADAAQVIQLDALQHMAGFALMM